jgi:prepilin-type N-terminal cleavage/methylation domain-containing protein
MLNPPHSPQAKCSRKKTFDEKNSVANRFSSANVVLSSFAYFTPMKIRVSPREGFTLIELLVVISIIAILAGIAVPAFTQVIEKGNQTKNLSNAKQIFLGLKMYAGDNDGVFPKIVYTNDGSGTTSLTSASNSNQAFRWLVPDYIKSEKIFYLSKSAWTPNPPDENTTTSSNDNLKAGENHFAYVINLTDTSNPNFPLIADGFSTTVGQYSTSETEKGGVWKGKAAIVVRVDGSGKVEKVASGGANANKVIGSIGGATNGDIFATSANWLATSQVPINPEAVP